MVMYWSHTAIIVFYWSQVRGPDPNPNASDVSDHASSRDPSHNGACTNGAYCTHKTIDPQRNNINKVTISGRLSDVTYTVGRQVDGLVMLEGALYSNESGDISCNVSRHDDSQHTHLWLPSHPLICGRAGILVQPPDEGTSPKLVVVGPYRGIQFENHLIDTLPSSSSCLTPYTMSTVT